jgi:hypothetical protein
MRNAFVITLSPTTATTYATALVAGADAGVWAASGCDVALKNTAALAAIRTVETNFMFCP